MAKKKKTRARHAPQSLPEPARRQSLWWEWIRSILIAVGIALLIRWPLIEPFRIPSGSMEPTLQDKDRIFVNKWAYGIRYPFNGFRVPFTSIDIWYANARLLPVNEPQRWDIVVFKAAEPGVDKHTLVKRIVGLPGERIHVHDGKIHIDGEALTLPEYMPDIYYTAPAPGTLTGMKYAIRPEDQYSLIPEGHYFVMGDNSAHSRDARYFGWLPERNMLGPVTSIWWPLGRMRDFTGYTGTLWWRLCMTAFGLFVVTRMFIARSWKSHDTVFRGSIQKGDHLLVNRAKLGIPLPMTRKRLTPARLPKRGDIVLYRTPNRQPGQVEGLLGRVAALPGEQVLLKDGALTINGAPPPADSPLAQLDLTNDAVGNYARSKSREYAHVPEDHLFILIDESDGAEDSRALGWIPVEALIGTTPAVWWPPQRIRKVR